MLRRNPGPNLQAAAEAYSKSGSAAIRERRGRAGELGSCSAVGKAGGSLGLKKQKNGRSNQAALVFVQYPVSPSNGWGSRLSKPGRCVGGLRPPFPAASVF